MMSNNKWNDQRKMTDNSANTPSTIPGTSRITISYPTHNSINKYDDNGTFLLGLAAKKELRNLLKSTTDPATTIDTFQKAHSLESCLIQGVKNANTIGPNHPKANSTSSTDVSFHLEGVLTFLGHLGVSRYEAHSALHEALTSTLLETIAASNKKSTAVMQKKQDGLFKLLQCAWRFVHIPDVQPIVIHIIKALGEDTPRPVLLELAKLNKVGIGGGSTQEEGEEKKSQTRPTMKYAPIFEQLPMEIKQFIYEADWTHEFLGDGTLQHPEIPPTTTTTNLVHVRGALSDTVLFAQILRPMVVEYITDIQLKQDADLAFVPGIRDKKINTASRRMASSAVQHVVENSSLKAPPLSSSSNTATSSKIHGVATTSTLLKKTSTVSFNEPESSMHKYTCALALSKIKEMIGTRPKLLGALFNILITEHGLHGAQKEFVLEGGVGGDGFCLHGPSSDQYITGGSSYLTCTLLSDLLITYAGQLPKQYETLCILANVLDSSVKEGIFTDPAFVQVQACLRILYPQDTVESVSFSTSKVATTSSLTHHSSPNPPSTKNIKISLSAMALATAGESSKDSATAAASTTTNTTERTWIRKIITDVIKRIKDCDPKNLFLHPVTDQIAPGYSSIIKKPICIRVMESKAFMNQYTSLDDFEKDVNLMFDNCMIYNVGNDGKWARDEATKQKVIWEEEIRKEARVMYETEQKKMSHAVISKNMTPVKSNAEINKTLEDDRKRKHDVLLAQHALAKERGMETKKLPLESIQPLATLSGKRRKKDADFPSMHALASMLLADPFVVRLLLDKLLRFIKVDIWREKTLPASHSIFPSLLQLLHLITDSTQLCRCKGKLFFIPSVGFHMNEGESQTNLMDGQVPSSYTLLRKSFPLVSKLWVEVDMDRRLSSGGDLSLITISDRTISIDASESLSSQGQIICACVQGLMIDVLQPGASHEALLTQIPRLSKALLQTAWDPMFGRPFFTSLIAVILKHKSKIPHTVRDLIASTWISWFHEGCMNGPVHEYFIKLLNEVCAETFHCNYKLLFRLNA